MESKRVWCRLMEKLKQLGIWTAKGLVTDCPTLPNKIKSHHTRITVERVSSPWLPEWLASRNCLPATAICFQVGLRAVSTGLKDHVISPRLLPPTGVELWIGCPSNRDCKQCAWVLQQKSKTQYSVCSPSYLIHLEQLYICMLTASGGTNWRAYLPSGNLLAPQTTRLHEASSNFQYTKKINF
jgi:hypothetical protein